MKNKVYYCLLLAVIISHGVGAQVVSGPNVVCPGQMATYYFNNGSDVTTRCNRIVFSAYFNGNYYTGVSLFDVPANFTPFTVTWPNEPGTGQVYAQGYQCCGNPACAYTDAVRVVQIGQASAITSSSLAICAGGQVTLTASNPCSPASYYWEAPAGYIFPLSGSNVLPVGPSQVAVQAPPSGASGQVSFSARANFGTGSTAPAYITLHFGLIDRPDAALLLMGGLSAICQNQSYEVLAYAPSGTSFSSWSVSGPVSDWHIAGSSSIIVSVSNTLSWLNSLFVSVNATNTCGTNVISEWFYPSPDCFGTGFPPPEGFSVFPNPPTSRMPVTATWTESVHVNAVTLVNPVGETVQTIHPDKNKAVFDTGNLPGGCVYLIKVHTDKQVITKRVVIPK